MNSTRTKPARSPAGRTDSMEADRITRLERSLIT
jgi:hypothetical protein